MFSNFSSVFDQCKPNEENFVLKHNNFCEIDLSRKRKFNSRLTFTTEVMMAPVYHAALYSKTSDSISRSNQIHLSLRSLTKNR